MEPGDRGDYLKYIQKKDIKSTVVEEKPVKKIVGDLNNDGVFDKKDKTLAAKTLASGVKKLFKKK